MSRRIGKSSSTPQFQYSWHPPEILEGWSRLSQSVLQCVARHFSLREESIHASARSGKANATSEMLSSIQGDGL
jgi:hypothetical protein